MNAPVVHRVPKPEALTPVVDRTLTATEPTRPLLEPLGSLPLRGLEGGGLLLALGAATAAAGLIAWAVSGPFTPVFLTALLLLLLYGALVMLAVACSPDHRPAPLTVEVEARRMTRDVYGLAGRFPGGACIDHLTVGTPIWVASGPRREWLFAFDREYPLDATTRATVFDRSLPVSVTPQVAPAPLAAQILELPRLVDAIDELKAAA